MKKSTLKQLFFFLLVILLSPDIQLYAQQNSAKIKVLNQHVLYMNELTKSLLKVQDCVTGSYFPLEYQRNKKGYTHVSGNYNCAKFEDTNALNKLLSESTILGSKNLNILKNDAQLLSKEYLSINNLCRELEIYIRLKDYTLDGHKKSDEIFRSLIIKFSKYNTIKKNYYENIVEIYKKFAPANIEYNQMKAVLDQEITFIGNFRHNVYSTAFTNSLPIENILVSIEKTEKILDKRFYDVKKSKSRSYKNFFSIYKNQLQELKCESIDRYSIDARKSDDYINRFVKKYYFYLNYYLIKDINDFVDASAQKLLYHPILIPNIKIDSIPQQYITEQYSYIPHKIPQLVPKNQGKEISEQTTVALNNYINFINQELKWSNNFPVRLTRLNLQANKHINTPDKYLSFTYSTAYAVPIALHKKIMVNSIHIPLEYRNILNRNLADLMMITHEKHQLVLELGKYTKTKEYKTDNFAKLYKILKRFEFLLNSFDEKKQLQYENCLQVFKSYNEPSETAWKLPAKEMLKLIDSELVALNEIKAEMKNKSYNKVAANKVREIQRSLIINQYENLKGLKRIGKNHGTCPYNPYEHLTEISAKYIEYIEEFPDMVLIKRNGIKHFENFIYPYNDCIDDYNKFIDLAAGGYELFKKHNKKPAFLLQNVKQPIYYKFVKPEIKEQEKTVIVTETPEKAPISMDGFAVNNLVLLLDVSGSMKAEEKLPLLRKSFLEILPYLRDEDEISIVVFSGKGKVLLNGVSCSDKEKITKVLEGLESRGQTNFTKGLNMAYKTARKNYKPKANNRIIIATDGSFTISEDLYQLAENEADNNTFLSVFRFGKDKFKAKALDKLARKGNGNYENIINENAKNKLLKELQALKVK